MTARELYGYALIEINKLEAPSLLLEDYNYFLNKAVQQYINKIYNRYDKNQQSSDDLRVLKASTILPLVLDTSVQNSLDILSKTYVCTLPEDYLHILNCIVEYSSTKASKCTGDIKKIYYPARRLTADMYSSIFNNSYLCPMYKRPYFYLNNVNSSSINVTNPDMDNEIITSDQSDAKTPINTRVSNVSSVRLEIRYGQDNTKFQADNVYIDYIKSPMFIRLTHTQIVDHIDTSQILEFPDYVCFEIINEFAKLILENSSDPRIQTNPVVNQTIPSV